MARGGKGLEVLRTHFWASIWLERAWNLCSLPAASCSSLSRRSRSSRCRSSSARRFSSRRRFSSSFCWVQAPPQPRCAPPRGPQCCSAALTSALAQKWSLLTRLISDMALVFW